MVPDITPLRRHSWSAPPTLLLDGCLARVKSLSSQLDKVSRLSRQNSWSGLSLYQDSACLVDALIEDLLIETLEKASRMSKLTRHCHHCHRPLSHTDHEGIGSGVKQCTLTHYELCPGGRKTSLDWTGCPATTDDDRNDSDTEAASLENKLNTRVTLDPHALEKALLDEANKAENVEQAGAKQCQAQV